MSGDFENCLAYGRAMQLEHRRLSDCLLRVEDAWRHCSADASVEQVVPVLQELEALCAELAHHFADEEAGGCLEQAVTRQPHLNEEFNRLQHEHAVLLEAGQAMASRLRHLDEIPAEAHDISEQFGRFAERLRSHFSAESRVLEEGLGLDRD